MMEDKKDLFLISGAAGFVGNNLIRELNQTNAAAEIRALCLPGESTASLKGLSCTIVHGDVTDPASLEKLFRIDTPLRYAHTYVIHCAGIIEIRSKPNPALQTVNVEGTRNMLQKASALDPCLHPRFLYVGSVHAIPVKPNHAVMTEVDSFDPALVVGQYAKSKAMASALVTQQMHKGLDAVILEPSGIIGPQNYSPENMKELIYRVATGRLRVCVPGGYDFVDVRDVAHGILLACRRGRSGQSYILSNRYITMLEICQTVCRLTGRKPIRVILPLWLAKLAAPLCERYYDMRRQVPLFTKYAVETVETNANFSHEKATKELGYTVHTLEQTLSDILHWMERSASE